MAILKTIIDTSMAIMNIQINMFGYNVSLMNVAVFSVLASLILGFIFRIFR